MEDIRVDENFEIDRPHNTGRLYNFLIDYKFETALKAVPFPIKGLAVLDMCCGSGMISEYYSGHGAKVSGIDLSKESIQRAIKRKAKYGFEATFEAGNATELPFANSSFDVVSVHDGLHHINEPWKAFEEMTRIAKKAVVIIEPAKSFLTRISVCLGISADYEGDDFVYRFDEEEIKQWLSKDPTIKEIKTKRYIMYYPHKPGPVFSILGLPFVFQLAKLFFYLVNILFGSFGNKIQAIAIKRVD